MSDTMSFEKSLKSLNWSWYKIREYHECSHYYGATFDEMDNDIFFYHLNEIEPTLKGSDDSDLEFDESLLIIDPRTNKVVKRLVEDHTDKSTKSKEIGCGERTPNSQSMLNAKRNKSTQKNQIKAKSKLDVITELIRLQSSNQQNLQNFIKSKYAEMLVTQSKDLKGQKTSYSLQTAIPFGGLNHKITSFEMGSDFTKFGDVLEYLENFKFSNIFRLNTINLASHSLKSRELNELFEFSDETDVYISEQTLQILLSSLGTLETWEIPFKIKFDDSQISKKIVFGESFPLRSQGNFVFVQMLENIIHSSMEQERKSSYMSLANGFIHQDQSPESLEVNAVDLNRKYRIELYDEYLQRILTGKNTKDSTTTNIITRKWTVMKVGGKVEAFNLMTEASIPYFELRANEPVFLNVSFKVVSSLDNETVSRNQLIREWLKLLFMPSGYTRRVLLDANSLEQLTAKDLSLTDIESELLNLYNIEPSAILGSLYSLLEIIIDFPEGDYMLKFNPKYPDKLMVFAETEGNDSNQIDISEMYKNILLEAKAPPIFDYMDFEGGTSIPLESIRSAVENRAAKKGTQMANRPGKAGTKKKKKKQKKTKKNECKLKAMK